MSKSWIYNQFLSTTKFIVSVNKSVLVCIDFQAFGKEETPTIVLLLLVRLLVGTKLNVHMSPPVVTASIISGNTVSLHISFLGFSLNQMTVFRRDAGGTLG